jgi:hypothetical protein
MNPSHDVVLMSGAYFQNQSPSHLSGISSAVSCSVLTSKSMATNAEITRIV